MSNETFWAIRRRELAKHEPVVAEKPKKAKKAKAEKPEPVEVAEEPAVSDADVTIEPAAETEVVVES